MALPFTETFGGTAGQELTAFNSNWTAVSGNLECSGTNELLHGTDDVDAHYVINSETFDDGQYAQCYFPTVDNDDAIGPAVRLAQASNAGYYTFPDSGGCDVVVYDGVGDTSLGSFGGVSTNDGLKIVITASDDIELYYDVGSGFPGTADESVGNDTTVASGSGGITGYGRPGATEISDFEAGNLAAGSSDTPLRRRRSAKLDHLKWFGPDLEKPPLELAA